MNRVYIYVVLAGLLFSSYGCQKDLDALPMNSKVYEITVLDPATAQTALNGAYYAFANATRVKTGWQQHQITPATMTGYLGYGYGQLHLEENRNEGNTTFWNESYVLLNAVNGVIKGIDDLPDNMFEGNQKKEMLAEAYFLRGYAHFRLLMFFSQWFDLDSGLGVLLRDELSTLGSIAKARSTVRESYDFILADLDKAITNGPASNEKHYATKWAAMVLKARVLMSRGTDPDFTEVITLTNNIISQGGYELEANPQDIFHSKGLSSEEIILGIKPQAQQELDYYSKSAQYWPGASALYVAKSALVDLLANDPRADWMIGSPHTSTSSPNTYYFAKYHRENTTPSQLSETDYAMRLTEVYLLKAEAIVRSGGSLREAKDLVQLIQSKSGITAAENSVHFMDVENAGDRETLLVEIFKETSRNLVAEDGMEWMALLRLPLATITQIKPTLMSTAQFIFPIPVSEFIYNPSFGDQNPGYTIN